MIFLSLRNFPISAFKKHFDIEIHVSKKGEQNENLQNLYFGFRSPDYNPWM